MTITDIEYHRNEVRNSLEREVNLEDGYKSPYTMQLLCILNYAVKLEEERINSAFMAMKPTHKKYICIRPLPPEMSHQDQRNIGLIYTNGKFKARGKLIDLSQYPNNFLEIDSNGIEDFEHAAFNSGFEYAKQFKNWFNLLQEDPTDSYERYKFRKNHQFDYEAES